MAGVHGMVGSGMARGDKAAEAGRAGRGWTRQGDRGKVGLGGHGRHGVAVMVWLVGVGRVRQGMDSLALVARAGRARHAAAGSGMAVEAGHDSEWLGSARRSRQGLVGLGGAPQGVQGRAWSARLGEVGQSRHGAARQGMAGRYASS